MKAVDSRARDIDLTRKSNLTDIFQIRYQQNQSVPREEIVPAILKTRSYKKKLQEILDAGILLAHIIVNYLRTYFSEKNMVEHRVNEILSSLPPFALDDIGIFHSSLAISLVGTVINSVLNTH
jgi:hypothetical protein